MRVIKTKTNRRFQSKVIKNNQKLFLLTIVYITGLFFGAYSIKTLSGDFSTSIQSLIENYYTVQIQQSIFQNFLYTLSSEVVLLFIPFLFGLCILGEPILWFVPLFRGLGTGLISGYLYKAYSLAGMGYFSTVILMPAVLSSAITVVACHESILTTRDIRGMIKNSSSAQENMMRFYTIRYIVLLLFSIFISILAALLIKLFAGKFSLFS